MSLAEGSLLVATDGSSHAAVAADFAALLAERLKAEVRLVHVISSVSPTVYGPEGAIPYDPEPLRAEGRKMLETAARAFAERGIPVQTALLEGPIVSALCAEASRSKASMIVVGSRGRSDLAGFLLGSVSDRLRHKAPVPVLVVRNPQPMERIVVGYDGSPSAKLAVPLAGKLARAFGAVLSIVYAIHADALLGPVTQIPEIGRPVVDEAVALLGPHGPPAERRVEFGHPVEALLRVAKQIDAGLIVVGTRGLGEFSQLFLGSVSDRVSHQASIPVLIAR